MFFFIPLDICFNFGLISMKIVVSVFLFIDNILGFNTSYFQNGKLIVERKLILKTYVKTFFYDFLTQLSILFGIFLPMHLTFLETVFFFQYRNFGLLFQKLIDRYFIDFLLIVQNKILFYR